MISSKFIREAAVSRGFTFCGVARSRSLSEHAAYLDSWLRNGYGSGLEYMERNIDKRTNPSALMDGARTVIVCGINYKNAAWDQSRMRETALVASYALAPDYHGTIKRMLDNLLCDLRNVYGEIAARCFTDSAPVLEKAWAIEAGLGWMGSNSLLVTPRWGSFVLLGEIVMDRDCDSYDSPADYAGCGDCSLCIDSCPSRAIIAPGVIDTGRCISRMTVERLPEGFEVVPGDLHGWIFGCDICQTCCPYNRKSPFGDSDDFDPVIEPGGMTEKFWKDLKEREFNDIFRTTPLIRAGLGRIKSHLG